MSDPCTTFLPALVDAAEGKLAPELEAHLESCAGCRAELTELTASLEAIAPAPAPEPGPWLAPKIRAHHEAKAPRQRLVRWALPALVPIALIFTVLWTGPSTDGGSGFTLDALEAELATMDPAAIEVALADLGSSYEDPDDPLVALASALADTEEEILDMVLAETSLGYSDYDNDGFDDAGALDEELELILEAIPG